MNIVCIRRILVLTVAMICGCQPSMQSVDLSIDLSQSPDGTVEVIELSGTELTHRESQFLSEVRRTDDQLVVVDFWADWCGPCHQLAPQLDLVKKEWKGKITLVKVDIDDNDPLAKFCNVPAIPQVTIFQGGKAVSGFVGVQSASQISSLLKSLQ